MKKGLIITVFIVEFVFISVSGLMAQDKYYCVPLDAFHGLVPDEDYCQCKWYFYPMEWNKFDYSWLTKPDSEGTLVADIHLPQGTIMRGFNLIYYDNGPYSIYVQVVRKNVWVDAYSEVIFSHQTSGAASNMRIAGEWFNELGIDGRQVKNQMFAYSVRIYFNSPGGTTHDNLYGVYGIRIVYF